MAIFASHKPTLDQTIRKNTKRSQLRVFLYEMIEKVVIRDSFKSDLFTQLVGEEMIFQRIIDSTNLKQDVEGGVGQLFSILKELEQSDSEQSNSGEESDDETTRTLLPLVNSDWSPSEIWYKKQW